MEIVTRKVKVNYTARKTPDWYRKNNYSRKEKLQTVTKSLKEKHYDRDECCSDVDKLTLPASLKLSLSSQSWPSVFFSIQTSITSDIYLHCTALLTKSALIFPKNFDPEFSETFLGKIDRGVLVNPRGAIVQAPALQSFSRNN